MTVNTPLVSAQSLTIGYGERIIQQDLSFAVQPRDVFVIMGGSGCGKSTLLRHLIGLQAPLAGNVQFGGINFWRCNPVQRRSILRKFGVLYQSAALWSNLTVAENVALPLQLYTGLATSEIADFVAYKLALVGLGGAGGRYPDELSGGMQKRAGLARAMALDPDLLFLDEPSAGLDPISSRQLDELILSLRDSLGATFVVVTHELPSIFTIANSGIFLDAQTRTAIAHGSPQAMLAACEHPAVRTFLTRGGS